ncbi:MAG: ATP-binding protein [Hyphomicrobium sp.]|jgi:DNA replication protein DnaC
MQEHQTMNSPHPCDEPEEPEQTIDALCKTHGTFRAKVIQGPFGPPITQRCQLCQQQARDESEARRASTAELERRNHVAELNREAGIPARFQSRSIESYLANQDGQKRVVNIARRFVDTWTEQREKGTSLIFTGGPGTGKTHLACAIGKALLESQLAAVRFGTVTGLLRSIKDTYRPGSERSEQQAFDSILQYDLLIVDEIGVQLGTDHEKLLLFEVLNERYQGSLPTILISNLSAADLEIFLGQRVMDRYRECGAVVAFDWPSHRGVK